MIKITCKCKRKLADGIDVRNYSLSFNKLDKQLPHTLYLFKSVADNNDMRSSIPPTIERTAFADSCERMKEPPTLMKITNAQAATG